jgi:hypothetical protein
VFRNRVWSVPATLLESMTAFLFDATADRRLGGERLISTMRFEEDLLVDLLLLVNLCDGIVVGGRGLLLLFLEKSVR